MTPIDAGTFWLRLLAGTAAAALTWIGAAAAGWRIASSLAPKTRPGDRFAIGLAVGYATVGSAVGVLALLHIAYPGFVALVPVALIAATARSVIRATADLPSALHRAAGFVRTSDWGTRIAVVGCVAASITGIVCAALPAVWWDPIAYHLPIAAAALAHRTFSFDPSMAQSGFPLLGEAAALPAFAVAGSAGAAMVTLGAGAALALVCGALAERLANGAGWLAAALVMTSPLWLWLAPSFYVDIPFALFSVASIGIGLAAIHERAGAQPGSIGLAGALAGAAAAVKYPGLEVSILSVMLLAFACGAKRSAKTIGFFLAAMLVVAGGWYVRTIVLTHDPVYPFLTAHLSADPATAAFADRYVTMTMQWCGGSGSLVDALLLPWRMLTGGGAQTYCGDVGYALRLGIVFFVVALFSARQAWPAVATSALLTAAWFAGSRQDRFIIPALCAYAVVVAVGIASAPSRLRRAGAVVMTAVGLVAIVAAWTPSLTALASNSIVPGFAYMTGGESGDAYLARRLEFYAADEWLRAHVRSGERVAALDDVRDYYAPAMWVNPYYQSAIRIDWTKDVDSRYRDLVARGVAYLVVNANRYYVDRTPTGVDWRVLSDDVRSGRLKAVYSANDVTVYRLDDAR